MYEEPQYIGWVFSRISEFHGIFNGEDHFFHYKTKRGFTAMKRKELTPEQIEHRRLRAQKYYQEHREYFRQMNQRYRQQHRVSISQKTIGEYCYHTIEQIQQKCPNKVERLLKQYPFEGFASRCLRRQLRYFHIYPSQARYDDCYDAGMMAYLYTIHRCAYMGYSYVEAYMAKLIRIYLICAVIVFPDAQNLCKENNLRELNLDQLPYAQV